jgi:hypothetical protein
MKKTSEQSYCLGPTDQGGLQQANVDLLRDYLVGDQRKP